MPDRRRSMKLRTRNETPFGHKSRPEEREVHNGVRRTDKIHEEILDSSMVIHRTAPLPNNLLVGVPSDST